MPRIPIDRLETALFCAQQRIAELEMQLETSLEVNESLHEELDDWMELLWSDFEYHTRGRTDG
jgi:hypothetical protein